MSAEASPVNSDEEEDEETLMPAADSNVIGSDDEDRQTDFQEDGALMGATEEEDDDDDMPMEPVVEEGEGGEEEEEELVNVDSGLRILSRGKRLKIWQRNVVRNHERPVLVETGEALAAMRYSGTKAAWPTIEPADIVVLKGSIPRADSDTKFSEGFIWYVRAVVEGSTASTTHMDAHTLIHIPKAVTTELIKVMSKDPRLQSSTLMKKFVPNSDNSKQLQPVGTNTWVVDTTVFTSAEVRETKKRKSDVEITTDAAAAPANGGPGSSSAASKKAKMDLTPIAPKKTASAIPKKINKPAEAPAKTPAKPPAKVNPVFAASKQPSKSAPAPVPVPAPAPPAPKVPRNEETHGGDSNAPNAVRHDRNGSLAFF